MKTPRVRLALLAGMGLLAACGRHGSPSPGAAGGPAGEALAAERVLRRGNGAEPASLDPHKALGRPELNVLRDLFEGLVAEAPNGDLVPGAAESWQLSDDGTTYTFALRAEGRWSNGDPVTADDFVYSFRRSLDPTTASRYAFVLAPIENAEAVAAGTVSPSELGVRAVDGRTLEITLEHPTPYFPSLLTHAASYPVHRPSVEAYGERFARPGNLVSNGAYRLDEWTVGSHVKLARNRNYWNDTATRIDTVYFYATQDASAELRRYRARKLDMTYRIPGTRLSRMRKIFATELAVTPYLGTYYYGLNLTQPPFEDNLALRRALALAIDRDVITRDILGTGEIPAYGWVPPVANYESQHMPEAEWSQEERETEARRLYAQAGYSAEHPLEVEILYNSYDDHRRVAAAVAAMWKRALGVETRLRSLEWIVYLDARERFDTQVYRASWVGDYNDAYTFAGLMTSQNRLDNTGYANPEYDRLLEAAAAEREPSRRAAYLEDAERRLLDDMPLIPIYFYVTARLVAPWVGGYEPNVSDHHATKDLYLLPQVPEVGRLGI